MKTENKLALKRAVIHDLKRIRLRYEITVMKILKWILDLVTKLCSRRIERVKKFKGGFNE